ncbi:MAG: ThiF family adenylyltransferase [Pseudomonadota bacterium]
MSAIRMIERDRVDLYDHLFSGDGLEAAAALVCGVAGRARDQLLVRKPILVPHEACKVRTAKRLTWPGSFLEQAIEEAELINGAVILMHSHPGGYDQFSRIDDESDRIVIPVLQHGGRNAAAPHGSAIMLPNGCVSARMYDERLQVRQVQNITSVGHRIRNLASNAAPSPLAYSSEMTVDLAKKTAVVVGVSGTGSITAELLARLGVGRLVLIDFDKIEAKNLNRIIYATARDIGKFKTHVLRDAIQKHAPNAIVETFETRVNHETTLAAASEADILFSCVDSMEGRYHCDLMAQAFLCPLIDMGVVIPTRQRDGKLEIADVCGRVDFVRPGGASLWQRGEVTGEGLAEEYLRRADPDDHARQVLEGYLKGVPEEAPSVISLNMRAASAAVNEWLARLYTIRHDANEQFASTYFSLAAGEEEHAQEPEIDNALPSEVFGQGLRRPLLGLLGPSHSERRAA